MMTVNNKLQVTTLTMPGGGGGGGLSQKRLRPRESFRLQKIKNISPFFKSPKCVLKDLTVLYCNPNVACGRRGGLMVSVLSTE